MKQTQDLYINKILQNLKSIYTFQEMVDYFIRLIIKISVKIALNEIISYAANSI